MRARLRGPLAPGAGRMERAFGECQLPSCRFRSKRRMGIDPAFAVPAVSPCPFQGPVSGGLSEVRRGDRRLRRAAGNVTALACRKRPGPRQGSRSRQDVQLSSAGLPSSPRPAIPGTSSRIIMQTAGTRGDRGTCRARRPVDHLFNGHRRCGRLEVREIPVDAGEMTDEERVCERLSGEGLALHGEVLQDC